MTSKRIAELSYFKDDNGKHRWTLTDRSNGKIVGAASQGYRRKTDARHNAAMVTGGGYRVVEAA